MSNVTLNATTAQKQNLGKTRIWGVQTDVEYRLGQSLRLSGGVSLQSGEGHGRGIANAALVGKYLPQVPKHRGSLQIAYSNPKYASVALERPVHGRAVQRRSERQLHPRPDARRCRIRRRHAGRACPATRQWT